jgi:hypothetical protein
MAAINDFSPGLVGEVGMIRLLGRTYDFVVLYGKYMDRMMSCHADGFDSIVLYFHFFVRESLCKSRNKRYHDNPKRREVGFESLYFRRSTLEDKYPRLDTNQEIKTTRISTVAT